MSLRELARDVGVSHGAPRRHFADKQALLDALALVGFRRLGATLAAADPGAGPFRARVQAVARAYVGFATREANLLEVMFAAKHTTPDPAIPEAGDRAFDPVLVLITDGQASGALAPGALEAFGLSCSRRSRVSPSSRTAGCSPRGRSTTGWPTRSPGCCAARRQRGRSTPTPPGSEDRSRLRRPGRRAGGVSGPRRGAARPSRA